MNERAFQANLIAELRELFPGCIVIKNDANYIQGFPDLLILFRDHWGCLEVKAFSGAHLQPNQEYYISKLNEMSFAALVYPENKEEILDALQQAFGIRG